MGSSEGSKPTETPKVPTVFIRSKQDDAGPGSCPNTRRAVSTVHQAEQHNDDDVW